LPVRNERFDAIQAVDITLLRQTVGIRDVLAAPRAQAVNLPPEIRPMVLDKALLGPVHDENEVVAVSKHAGELLRLVTGYVEAAALHQFQHRPGSGLANESGYAG